MFFIRFGRLLFELFLITLFTLHPKVPDFDQPHHEMVLHISIPFILRTVPDIFYVATTPFVNVALEPTNDTLNSTRYLTGYTIIDEGQYKSLANRDQQYRRIMSGLIGLSAFISPLVLWYFIRIDLRFGTECLTNGLRPTLMMIMLVSLFTVQMATTVPDVGHYISNAMNNIFTKIICCGILSFEMTLCLIDSIRTLRKHSPATTAEDWVLCRQFTALIHFLQSYAVIIVISSFLEVFEYPLSIDIFVTILYFAAIATIPTSDEINPFLDKNSLGTMEVTFKKGEYEIYSKDIPLPESIERGNKYQISLICP